MTSTCTTNRFFTGQTQDVVKGPTGIYDFLFREHSAGMGRWLTPDPAGRAAVDLTNPQTWNRYAYVANNPLSNVDPLGLIANVVPQPPAPSFWDIWGDVWGRGWNRFEYQVEPPDREAFHQTNAQPSPQPQPPLPDNAPNNGSQPDKKSCASRLAAGVQNNTGVTPTNLQYTGSVGGHANYTFDVSDPTGFQSILNQNMPWSWAGSLDQGHRYGIIQSTHILDPLNGAYSGHTDLFSGHSILAPLHWIVDVGIGHIPGVNLDFGCKAGS